MQQQQQQQQQQQKSQQTQDSTKKRLFSQHFSASEISSLTKKFKSDSYTSPSTVNNVSGFVNLLC
jgi:hypothetical protein